MTFFIYKALLGIATCFINSLLIDPIVGFSLVCSLQKGGLQRVDLKGRPSGSIPDVSLFKLLLALSEIATFLQT